MAWKRHQKRDSPFMNGMEVPSSLYLRNGSFRPFAVETLQVTAMTMMMIMMADLASVRTDCYMGRSRCRFPLLQEIANDII
jgi:hypothetical protein